MSDPEDGGGRLVRAINQFAFRVSVVVLAGLGAFTWVSLSRPSVKPSWPASGIVPLTTTSATAGDRWIVALNPECTHCGERLAALDSALATRPAPPALGVLLVDVAGRPDSLAGAARFTAGVWWDQGRVWRSRWRRHAYGEVLVFAPDGRLRSILPPDSSAARAGR